MRVIVVVTIALFLSGCTLNRAPFFGLPCSVGPVVLDKGASTRLTRPEKEQIVTLNEAGAKLCGWRSPT